VCLATALNDGQAFGLGLANADGDPAGDGYKSVNSWSLQCGASEGSGLKVHKKE